ncbi:MAG TPA: SUMF1/EgtB/PvdO family nonheme iron enzyme [Kofleriaceae bacterium]|nr:SUMF1/EgtB/PvdO family nonheme iron enzyme [Kofleriaceae bacterium]
MRRLAVLVLLIGCGEDSAATTDASATSDDAGDAVPDAAGPCPAGMAHITATSGAFCIDRHEGALEERASDGTWSPASPFLTVGTRTVRAVPAAGITPQGYISGVEAKAACAASGKHLCTSAEWLAACRGSANNVYPYGATHVAGACNDAYSGHPVVNYFGTSNGVFDSQHMNDPGINQQPDSLAKGGAFTQCTTPDGVFDMHGNLHEWIDDAAGTFRGGFYADASLNGPGCTYATTAHAFSYHDYSTGFRCCAGAN